MREWTREEFENQLAREREDREPANPHDQVERPRQMTLEARDPDADARHIAAAPNPFERLARQWEAESRRLQLNPESRCPSEIVKARMAELLPMLDEVGT
jgi:hypothetical protein